jgi:hypothetical protein
MLLLISGVVDQTIELHATPAQLLDVGVSLGDG